MDQRRFDIKEIQDAAPPGTAVDNESAVTLDLRGLYCPEPVMRLHEAVRGLRAGDRIRVLASDPATRRDIPKFCLFLGHLLLDQSESNDVLEYQIETGAEKS